MSAILEPATAFRSGEAAWEVCIYRDDGDDPIAGAGPGGYVRSREEAREKAAELLSGLSGAEGWYASICNGKIVDSVGDGLSYDYSFEPGDEAETINPEGPGRMTTRDLRAAESRKAREEELAPPLTRRPLRYE